MNSLSVFFISIGVYNLLGSLLLLGLLSNAIGDSILRKQFKILAFPYDLNTSGSLWLIWAAALNFFFSFVNILAFRWDSVAQFDLLLIDIILYAFFVCLSIIALFSPKYSIGIWFNFPIFLFWIFWALYLFFY